MARPAAAISRTRAVATTPIIRAPGYATADSIAAALKYLRGQPFIRRDGTVIVGHSAGAWGALALAAEGPSGIAMIVAFAPGRGGHANDFSNQVCAPQS